MPLSTLVTEVAGFGDATIVHVLPFHCSTRVSVLEARWALPTATHQVALRHDTEESVVTVEPVGLGLGTTAQAEPFHARASVPELVDPTAAQKLGPAHETPSKVSLVVEGWLGLVTIDQAVPFHCSISVAPVAVVSCPTATQKDELTQVTPDRWFGSVGEADGTVTLVHDVALTVGGTVMGAACATPTAVASTQPTMQLATKVRFRNGRRMPPPWGSGCVFVGRRVRRNDSGVERFFRRSR